MAFLGISTKIFHSRKNSKPKGGKNPKPKADKVDKGKGKAAEVCLGTNKIPIIATFDLDFPTKSGYTSAIRSVSDSFSQNRVFDSDLSRILVYEKFVYDDISVFGLINRQEIRLLAVITGESVDPTVVVLVDQGDFDAVEKFLKKEEGLEAAMFLYFSSPAEYPIEHVTFTVDIVRQDIKVISEMNESSVRVFENVILFARFFCLFVIPAIFPEWRDVFSKKVMNLAVPTDDDVVNVFQLTDYMVDIWNNWDKISDYVRSGGLTVLPDKLEFFNLELAQSQLSIMKSADMKTPLVPTICRKVARGYHSVSGPLAPVGDAGPSDILRFNMRAAAAAGLPLFSTPAGLTLPTTPPAGPSTAPDGPSTAPDGPSTALAVAGPSTAFALGPLLVQRFSKFFKKIPK